MKIDIKGILLIKIIKKKNFIILNKINKNYINLN